MIQNVLAAGIQLFNVNGAISLNFLEKFIEILINGVGITGLGIILYCLILKVVVLPLDIWQKISTKNQSVKMESMREQLEKLQVQYANTPEIYQQKMQEVYKANNFNMFSACIPMIATLVILILAFQSLTGFSQYKNLTLYTDMAKSYDTAILAHYEESNPTAHFDENGVEYIKYEGADDEKYIYALKLKTNPDNVNYYINIEKVKTVLGKEDATEAECVEYVKKQGREAAATTYGQEKEGFFWIENIYYPDVTWAHPLQNYTEFCKAITNDIVKEDGAKVKIDGFISENTYNEITFNLEAEKTKPNGFFILVVLTILTNVSSQIIAMFAQKAQRDLQSADKSSKTMQTVMMFVMPAMFCVFAFIYSGAFSLYLITSGLFSLISTLVVNKIIDIRLKGKQEQAEIAQITTGGRKNLTRDWERNRQIMGGSSTTDSKKKK